LGGSKSIQVLAGGCHSLEQLLSYLFSRKLQAIKNLLAICGNVDGSIRWG
jgi:hypothetical protein